MEILFGYRYKTPDGFNAICTKFKGKHVWLEIRSSWVNPFLKVKPKLKKYLLTDIKTFNEYDATQHIEHVKIFESLMSNQ